MPQLMPLNWIISIFMFFMIFMSMCNIFSMEKENKWLNMNMNMNMNMNKWFW